MVNTMSSLKKHVFTSTPVIIALQDFAPNAASAYCDNTYALRSSPAEETPTSPTTGNPLRHKHSFTPQLVHYVVIDKLNVSPPLSAPVFQTLGQPSRIPAFNDYSSTARTQNTQKNSADKLPVHTTDFWLLTQHDRTLVKDGLRISLTTLESALIKKMLHHEERVVSKEELIRNIGREPELYRGLEMCLSRLQEKFKRVNGGERLFRSVRNRGYCLTQKIKKSLELTPQRR